MAKTATIYTTSGCAYCIVAKNLLRKNGYDIEEIQLDSAEEGRAQLIGKTGYSTFPQILVDNKLIGGYSQLVAHFNY